jgi:hypothetical protein
MAGIIETTGHFYVQKNITRFGNCLPVKCLRH